MHEFGPVPKTSMIPRRLMELVPVADRDKWADRIVEEFKRQFGMTPTEYRQNL